MISETGIGASSGPISGDTVGSYHHHVTCPFSLIASDRTPVDAFTRCMVRTIGGDQREGTGDVVVV